MVTKHPLEQNSGKISAQQRAAKHLLEDDQCKLDDADKMSTGRRRSGNSLRVATSVAGAELEGGCPPPNPPLAQLIPCNIL